MICITRQKFLNTKALGCKPSDNRPLSKDESFSRLLLRIRLRKEKILVIAGSITIRLMKSTKRTYRTFSVNRGNRIWRNDQRCIFRALLCPWLSGSIVQSQRKFSATDSKPHHISSVVHTPQLIQPIPRFDSFHLFTDYVDVEDDVDQRRHAAVRRGARLLPAAESRGRPAQRHLYSAQLRIDRLLRPAGRTQGTYRLKIICKWFLIKTDLKFAMGCGRSFEKRKQCASLGRRWLWDSFCGIALAIWSGNCILRATFRVSLRLFIALARM